MKYDVYTHNNIGNDDTAYACVIIEAYRVKQNTTTNIPSLDVNNPKLLVNGD